MKTFGWLMCFLLVTGSAFAYDDDYGDNPYGSSVRELTPQEKAFEAEQTELYRNFLKLVRDGYLKEAEVVIDRVQISRYNQGGLCYLANALTNKGDLSGAERVIAKIKDPESHQYAMYRLATDGYASRGMIPEAIKVVEDLVASFGERGENRAIPREPKILVDVVVAVTENRAGYSGDQVIDSVMEALSHVKGGIYYELMAVEQVVLRLPDQGSIEDFLVRAGYIAYSLYAQDDMTVVVYNSTTAVQLVVGYGNEGGTLKAFAVNHQLDEKSQQEFEQSRHCDEDLQDWLKREEREKEDSAKPQSSLSIPL